MHMSHKKRASTALKSMGAAGLAAATIVSGLSFGAPAVASSSQTQAAPTAANSDTAGRLQGRFVLQYRDGVAVYYGANAPKAAGDGRLSYQQTTVSKAAAEAATWTFPAFGTTGEVRGTGSASDVCLTMSEEVNTLVNYKCDGRASQNLRWLNIGGKRGLGPVSWSRSLMVTSDSIGNRLIVSQFSTYNAIVVTDLLTPVTTGLVATVSSINHAAKSAVVSGTATPNGTVAINGQVANVNASGAWSMTVTGLAEGANTLTAIQTVNNTEVDRKNVVVTINDAAIVGQDGAAVALERGEDTQVEALFKTNGSVSRPQGKVEFTAPEGTTFADDQGTIEGSFKKPGEDAWTNAAMTLTNGVRSEDGTKYTYDFVTTTTTWNLPDASLMRWNIDVDTPADAVADTSSMSATLVGTAIEGAFNTTSTTATTVEAPAETPLEAKVDSVDNVNKTAVVSGTATKGATVAIGDESVEVTNDDGSWTLTVGGLEYGDNTLHVVQTIGGREFDSTDVVAKVDGINRDFTVATPENESEHKGESVTFSGNGRAGETVRVHVTNFDSADVTAKVDDDGHWSVSRWIGTGMYVFDVTQTNAAGSVTGEVRGLTINKPADEDPVNLPWAVTAPESGSEHRGEMVTWTGTGNAGDTVSFTPKNPEQSAWSTVVKNNGTWSVDHFAGTGAYDIDVVMKNAAGSVTGESKNVLLNQSVNLPFAVTSPESGTDHKGELVTFEGTGNANEEISLEVTNFESSSPTPVRVDRTGHWKIEKFLGTGAYTIDITQKNVSTGLITGEAKDLKFNQPSDEDPVNLPWAITSPESGSEHLGENVTWSGTGNAGDTVYFTPKNPEQSSWTTVVGKNGRWSVNRWAGVSVYDVDVVMKNSADAITGESKNIVLNSVVNLPFAVTSPENGSDHRGEPVTFEGTGNANEEISLKVTNFESAVATTRVDRTGHWKIEKFLGTGAYTIDITQKNVSTGDVTGEAKGLQFNQPAS